MNVIKKLFWSAIAFNFTQNTKVVTKIVKWEKIKSEKVIPKKVKLQNKTQKGKTTDGTLEFIEPKSSNLLRFIKEVKIL